MLIRRHTLIAAGAKNPPSYVFLCSLFIPLSPLRESEEGASVYLSTNTPSLSSKKTAA
ncbi:hypothetical protein C7382_1021, partial [Porphyromonas loveana]